jgi:hypothetical protein
VSPEQHWPLHGAELFIAVCGYAVRVTAGTGRRPTGPETKPIERSASAPTVVELLASFAFPFIVITIARSNWVLPSIALTIGPLLLWIDHLVHIPSFRPGGLGLDRRPLVLVAVRVGVRARCHHWPRGSHPAIRHRHRRIPRPRRPSAAGLATQQHRQQPTSQLIPEGRATRLAAVLDAPGPSVMQKEERAVRSLDEDCVGRRDIADARR